MLFENDNLAKEAIKKGYRPVSLPLNILIYILYCKVRCYPKEDYVNGKIIDNFENEDDDFKPFYKNSFGFTINPASGLPMINEDISGVDIGGNLYGTNNDDDDN